MEPTSFPTPAAAPRGATGCAAAARSSRSVLRRWWIPAVAGVVLVAAVAVALGQGWLAFAALAPLLYVLPCALMMVVCMRHMNHREDKGAAPLPTAHKGPTQDSAR